MAAGDEPQGGESPCLEPLLDDEGRVPDRVAVARAYGDRVVPGRARVLVDRVWPRGVTREALRCDLWLPAVAPSTELRRWFGHDGARWPAFVERYRVELARPPRAAAVAQLLDLAAAAPLTLVFGARDRQHNQAVALAALLRERLGA